MKPVNFNQIEKKAMSRLNIFKLLVKNSVNNATLIHLYKTYVQPLFDYGSISFLTSNTQRLQKIQNEFIRLSLHLPRYIRTDLIHEAAGLELVTDRLTVLNKRLFEKMSKLEGVKQVVERSLQTVPLNNLQSPLDKLLTNMTT